MVDDVQGVWSACAALLRAQVSDGVWQSTFQQATPIHADGHVLTLAVPNKLVKDRIENRYVDLIRGVLDDVGATIDDLDIVIHADGSHTVQLAGGLPIEDGGLPPVLTPSVPNTAGPSADERVGNTDDRYTFSSFVQGTSNRFAHAAALAVAETPGRSYNPLFIYGGAGLGKTHLLQAIANYVVETYPDQSICYVSTETFLNEFVESIRHNTQPEFKRRYREIDVLLVDDIQFMEGKEGLQEEFFHTFNSLHQQNRQIVMSSDRPPDSISTLEERLRSRFKMGLITDIQPPDLETRIAILRQKAERDTHGFPEDVLEYIATHITNNIRELEGALIRVNAYASLTNETITVELASQVLSDVLTENEPRPITAELILDRTADMFGMSIEEITGKSRRRPLVTARQIAMYVTRELTDLSYPAIAREFGGRDHTTIIHACEKVRNQISERRQIYDQVTALTQRVKQ